MAQNLTTNDIDQWQRSAPPEQVVQIAHKLLDTIANYPQQQRDSFVTGMKRDTRNKLFETQPV